MMPQKDRDTAIGNMNKKFGEDRLVVPKRYDHRTKNTHTYAHRLSDKLITILRSPIGDGVTICNYNSIKIM